MGKFSVKKDKGADEEAGEPKLVNKVEHNSSFKDADKTKAAAANGEANGKTRKDSGSSSSSSSDDGEKDDKVCKLSPPK